MYIACHFTEAALDKQHNDKDRVLVTLENLLDMVGQQIIT